ncbi:hypothetical protein BUALT_Bualt11G0000400 [Buddleja alternifolia]|uniref:GDSL esterase/lipase n=1 Tax=Buddleja alternifolia TaxID=168488 RepID=A0AAV6X269_9LAMI|nr:hypothetical protein BUALT_Bualt11G0000400 [Buddleja alternifolia]
MEFGWLKWTGLMLAMLRGLGGVIGEGSPQFTSMFVFRDSLIDPGNNNYLRSLAKANYLPYGVDFYQGPSGRFCNGRTVIDYLGDMLGISLPAYANLFATEKSTFRGVNYASAAGGTLEETGQNLGERYSLSQQVQNLESTLSQLKNLMEDDQEELSSYLAKALVIMALVHSLGLRKFLVGGIGPLGCIPNQLATDVPPPGKCASFTNDIVGMFNDRLISLVDELNSKYNGSVFAYANIYGGVTDILNNAKAYGFSVVDKACCGGLEETEGR